MKTVIIVGGGAVGDAGRNCSSQEWRHTSIFLKK